MILFGHFSTTQEFTFKKLVKGFQVTIRFHPDHRQQKANTHT